MTVFQAAILGVVQGITEFLPISSSGHLALFQQYFGVTDSIIEFDIWIHVATLFAIGIFFFQDLLKMRIPLMVAVVVGSLPAVVIGLATKDYMEAAFASTLWVGLELIATGFINLWTDRQFNKPEPENAPYPPNTKQSLLIGLAQAVAIIPGISRSGTTVAGGVLAGLKREDAFHFSFMLGMPAIAGAAVLELKDFTGPQFQTLLSPTYLVGFLAAFVSGLASLAFFKYVIQKARLEWFGYYCIVLGAAAVVLSLI